MIELQITHIDKPDRDSQVESIRAVAGIGWGPWTLSQAVAWAEIEGNQFVVASGFSTTQVDVMPPRTILGNKYLRTRANSTLNDNLLSLPSISRSTGLWGHHN